MAEDARFLVTLVIPADQIDEDADVFEAIRIAHRYMHEAGAGDAPCLELAPSWAIPRWECANLVGLTLTNEGIDDD